MAERGGLENRCTFWYRGFESHPLRSIFALYNEGSLTANPKKKLNVAYRFAFICLYFKPACSIV